MMEVGRVMHIQGPGSCNMSLPLKHQLNFSKNSSVLLHTGTCIGDSIDAASNSNRYDGTVNVYLFPHPEYFTEGSLHLGANYTGSKYVHKILKERMETKLCTPSQRI